MSNERNDEEAMQEALEIAVDFIDEVKDMLVALNEQPRTQDGFVEISISDRELKRLMDEYKTFRKRADEFDSRDKNDR